jgi:hypothetical protein
MPSGEDEPDKFELDLNALATVGERLAIARFITGCTVPILKDRVVWGSGTLFRIGPEHFIVTAAHVIDATDAKGIAFSADESGIVLVPLKGAEIVHYQSEGREPDLAAIQLQPSMVSDIRERHFLGLENIFPDKPDTETPVLICGYPVSTNPRGLKSPTIFLTRERTPPVKSFITADGREVATDPGLHYFMEHASQIIDVNTGAIEDAFSLKGMSGCSVWTWFAGPEGEAWYPKKVVKVFAVQVAQNAREHWIRATGWGAIARLIAIRFPAAKGEIERFYGPVDLTETERERS